MLHEPTTHILAMNWAPNGLVYPRVCAPRRKEGGFGVDVEVEASEDGREVSLPVMGVVQAGARTPSRLQPRQAARVQTGAPMPTLADAVLPLRWTDGGESRVRVLRSVRSVNEPPDGAERLVTADTSDK